MKPFILLIALASLLMLNSCELSVDPEDEIVLYEDLNNYFPLAVGNYWVYEREVYEKGDSNTLDYTVIDSLVVVKDSTINFGKTYLLQYFIDDSLVITKPILAEKNMYSYSQADGWLPFLADAQCGCPGRGEKIAFLTTKMMIEDSINYEGQAYPSRIVDNQGNEIIQISQSNEALAYKLDYNGVKKYTDHSILSNELRGRKYLFLVSPENAKLKRSNDSTAYFFNDDRAAMMDDFILRMHYQSGVGPVYMEQFMILPGIKQTRKLLRYEVK